MNYEFSFILPCLNEEKSLQFCLDEIKGYINKNNLNAEIIVVDNNSSDNSVEIVERNNARLVIEKKQGYGYALITGINNAYGIYCIMGDSDGSYDFSNLDMFIQKVREGYDLVVGNRFKGGISKNAMPISHKIGGKCLTNFANLFYHTGIRDFHCGLRSFNRLSIKSLNLNKGGMEFASEMIIKAKKKNLKLIEVPTILRKDLRNGRTHLKTIRDGFRHLNLIINLIGD